MYEILKAIATANDWVFLYGRSDYQNLFDSTEQKEVPHIFLDPVEIGENRSDTGGVESKTYSGFFTILFSSDIDEISYDERYQKYMKPIIDNKIGIIEKDLICEQQASLDAWKKIELINVFNYNLDGIGVTYKITIDE